MSSRNTGILKVTSISKILIVNLKLIRTIFEHISIIFNLRIFFKYYQQWCEFNPIDLQSFSLSTIKVALKILDSLKVAFKYCRKNKQNEIKLYLIIKIRCCLTNQEKILFSYIVYCKENICKY